MSAPLHFEPAAGNPLCWFTAGIREWTETGAITHDASHVRPLPELPDSPEKQLGEALAAELLADKAIIGVFDEGCMGMYNAIFDDELINPLGIYKERLSQSALWAEMQRVDDSGSRPGGAGDTAVRLDGDVCRRLGVPIAQSLPVGHGPHFAPLPLGATY